MKLSVACAFLAAMFAGSATAGEPGAATAIRADDASTHILALLAARFPDIKIREVHPSSVEPGFYEVITDRQLVYTDATASRLFVGYIVDTQNRDNLTAKRWSEINLVDYKSLPFEQAIKTVRGDGSRQLVIFEDPLCPYCRKLEQDISGLSNVTIYRFLFPLEKIHPGASDRAKQIWCAPSPADAWSHWMLNQSIDPGTACNTDPISDIRALADRLRINATPTLIFPDGSRIEAAASQEDIEKHFGRMARLASVHGAVTGSAN